MCCSFCLFVFIFAWFLTFLNWISCRCYHQKHVSKLQHQRPYFVLWLKTENCRSCLRTLLIRACRDSRSGQCTRCVWWESLLPSCKKNRSFWTRVEVARYNWHQPLSARQGLQPLHTMAAVVTHYISVALDHTGELSRLQSSGSTLSVSKSPSLPQSRTNRKRKWMCI